jgi:hypothetical protein
LLFVDAKKIEAIPARAFSQFYRHLNFPFFKLKKGSLYSLTRRAPLLRDHQRKDCLGSRCRGWWLFIWFYHLALTAYVVGLGGFFVSPVAVFFAVLFDLVELPKNLAPIPWEIFLSVTLSACPLTVA